MNDPSLADALDRAERALDRIEQAGSRLQAAAGSEALLREKVRGVVAELDDMIREAGAR